MGRQQEPPTLDWEADKARRRRRALTRAGVAAAVGAVAVGWFTRPPPRPQPHEGRVLAVAGAAGGLSEAVVVYSPAYAPSFYGLEHLHPFDLRKYDKIARGLVADGLLDAADFFEAAAASEQQLERGHSPEYLESLTDPAVLAQALEAPVPGFLGEAAIGRRLLGPFAAAVGGTLLAAEHAAQGRLAINLGGGFHHARPDMGHGFCVYNDVAVAILALRAAGFSDNVLIVDTDAHQGDGSHAFFGDDPSVFSLSLHQDGIFPNPKLPGDLDVPLPGGSDDRTFLAALDRALSQVPADLQPGLVVHVSGSDVLQGDPLATLRITPQGMRSRDLAVARWTAEHRAGLLHVLAGGYGPRSAEAHQLSLTALLRGEWGLEPWLRAVRAVRARRGSAPRAPRGHQGGQGVELGQGQRWSSGLEARGAHASGAAPRRKGAKGAMGCWRPKRLCGTGPGRRPGGRV